MVEEKPKIVASGPIEPVAPVEEPKVEAQKSEEKKVEVQEVKKEEIKQPLESTPTTLKPKASMLSV